MARWSLGPDAQGPAADSRVRPRAQGKESNSVQNQQTKTGGLERTVSQVTPPDVVQAAVACLLPPMPEVNVAESSLCPVRLPGLECAVAGELQCHRYWKGPGDRRNREWLPSR